MPDVLHDAQYTRFVQPEVFMVGFSVLYQEGLEDYLKASGNEEFLESVAAARAAGMHDGEIMCSLFAKLCYASLTLGKNTNVSRIRDIPDNFRGCFDTGHGSVFEHCQINFIVRNCSRVYTHEQVRHRIAAYSQTSGRFCRLDRINLILDPILDPVAALWNDHLKSTELVIYLSECKLGLRKPSPDFPNAGPTTWLEVYEQESLSAKHITIAEGESKTPVADKMKWVPDNSFDFEKRKKITSAIRRIAPNGQANEIGMSLNIRTLRHIVTVRTSRHAEWEIRAIYAQAYHLVAAKFPLLFYGAKVEEVNGLPEITGMKHQPYEIVS
jgi:thymidylate synthase ThyX